MIWRGVTAQFMQDETRHIDFEGAFRVGKTTAALWKVFNSCLAYPGIHWLICRYSDGDTQTKLKPPWRQICDAANVKVQWDSTELCDTFPAVDGKQSKVYIFGIKAQDQTSRYGKFRGMTLAGIYNDQSEELPHDVFLEMMGRLSQSGFPHQLLLTPNPPDPNHWLAKEFPEDNTIVGRHYYSAPIQSNAHNLPADTIPELIRAYPPAHPKHRSAVLGKRGLNVIGQPVYGGDPEKGLAPMFLRTIHERPLTMNPMLPLCEAVDFGKHHPCVIWAQFTPYGGLHVLGGLMGQDLFLKDFCAALLQRRAEWFPNPAEVWTTCDPAGSHDNSQGIDENGVDVLKKFGLNPRYSPNANGPNIRLAMVERLGAYMRTRSPQGEAFGIDDRHWLLLNANGHTSEWKFLADGLEAGYVWDEHFISVGSKQMRRPKKDGWYEHGQNCLEYLELEFGGAQQSLEQIERSMAARKREELRRAQQDVDPYDWQRRRSGTRRLRA